jgi:transcriptional regulator with XRE-family HTH domain
MILILYYWRNIMNSLGQRIKKVRKEKGLTQKELADNKISHSMLSLVENDVARTSIATLCYIAQKLETSLSYFLSDEEEVCQKRPRDIGRG